MTTWLTLLGMALVTYASRVITLLALRGEVVLWLRRWLGYVPVAVFTALVVKPLLTRDVAGGTALAIGPAFPAGIVGALIAWRTGNVLATIVAGMAAFWTLRWLGM
jgi:branched-subunit amino acid transport protein